MERAWALYAGLAYLVTKRTDRTRLPLYIDLGSATSGPLDGYDNTPTSPYEFNHITSQDLKLGVRFNLNALEPSPRYEQPIYSRPMVNSRG
jgi:hypothetical protein